MKQPTHTRHKEVSAIKDALEAHFVDRDSTPVILAMLCQEHAFVMGPPGNAKSALNEALASCFTGIDYFDLQLNKFTVVDEVFGPMDLAKFQNEKKFERNLTGRLAACHLANLDEIWKGNGAALNTMLQPLQERRYAGAPIPLRCAISTSNEFPQDTNLAALYDRFLFRDITGYIKTRRNKRKLYKRMASKNDAQQRFVPPATLTIDEWDEIKSEVERVDVPDAVLDLYLDVIDKMEAEGCVTSDRRAIKALKAIKASAWLANEYEAAADDLQALKFCLWNTPQDREKLVAILDALERQGAHKVLQTIDEAMAAYNERPQTQAEIISEFPNLISRIDSAKEEVMAALKSGKLSKRAAAKVRKRGLEMKAAKEDLGAGFNKSMGVEIVWKDQT